MDDGQYAGSLPQLEHVLANLQALTPTTGLSLNLKKCELVLSSQVGIDEASSLPLLSQVGTVAGAGRAAPPDGR